MVPEWFSESDLPYSRMWACDHLFYPMVFKNTKFCGYFVFKGTECMEASVLKPVEDLHKEKSWIHKYSRMSVEEIRLESV